MKIKVKNLKKKMFYSRVSNYDVVTIGSVSKGDYFNNSQTSESAIGVSA